MSGGRDELLFHWEAEGVDGYCLTVYDIGDKRISNMNMCTRKEASAERVYKVMVRIVSSSKCSTPLHNSNCLN